MKLRFANQGKDGWLGFELLVVVLLTLLLLCLLFVLLIPPRRVARIVCVSNMGQIGLAYCVWENDNNHEQISFARATNENSMQLNIGQQAWFRLIGLSNIIEMSSAKILRCPFDSKPSAFTVSTGHKIEISYFLCPDASETYPQMILSGDDNLAVNGVPVKPGILEVTNIAAISWTKARHGGVGTLAFADGSVAEESALGFQTALYYATNGTPITPTRLAVP